MGWQRTIERLERRARLRPSPGRLFAATLFTLCVLSVLVTVALLRQGPAPAAMPHSVHREFVGFPLADCFQSCDPGSRLAAWENAHPHATILDRMPVREAGILVGFWVTYEGESV